MTSHRQPRQGRSQRLGWPHSPAQRRLIAAAFHEAGHAVAAYHLRVRFRRVAVGGNEPTELGWLELWPAQAVPADGVPDLRTEHAVERRVIVLLAGAQAERMGVGRARYLGSSLDFYEAVRHAGQLCRTRAELSAYLRWMQLRVRALVESPGWRQPIEALADQLRQHRRLGAREARAIIRGRALTPRRACRRPGHGRTRAAAPARRR